MLLHAPQPGQVPKEMDPEFMRSPSPSPSLVMEEDVGEEEEVEVPEDFRDLWGEFTMDLTMEEAISPSQVTVLTLLFFLFSVQKLCVHKKYLYIVLP